MLANKHLQNKVDYSLFNEKIVAQSHNWSKKASIIVMLIGVISMLGWCFDIGLFKSIFPGLVTIKVNTSIAFILSGYCLYLWPTVAQKQARYSHKNRSFWLFSGLAITVMAIGLLTVIEYSFKLNLGIDQWLFKDPDDLTYPGRMGLNTAINFTLIGSAFLLLKKRLYTPAQILTIINCLISLTAFLGYIYDITSMHTISQATGMAIHTSISFICLGIGILLATLKQGLMTIVSSNNAGGASIRLLLPYILGIPPLASGLALLGQRLKFYNEEGSLAILGVFNLTVFAVAIWWNAQILGKIDEKQQANLVALQISEGRLKLAMDSGQIGLWDWHIQTEEMYLSQELLHLSGYSQSELTETAGTWMNLLHPEDQPKVTNLLNAHLAGETPIYKAEFRLRHKSGRWHWILDQGKVVERDADGHPVRMTGTHQDISDRKQAELEQQKLLAIIENSPDFIGLADLDGRTIYVNISGQKLAGFHSLTAAKTTIISDFVSPEDLEFLEQEILPKAIKNGVWSGEFRLRHFVTGELIPIEMNVFTVRDPNTEEIIGLAHITRDLREKKALEKELVQKQALFDAFFQASCVGMCIFNSELDYLQINSSLASINGLPVAEHIGKNFQEVLPELATLLEPTFQQILATNQPVLNTEISGYSKHNPTELKYWLNSFFPLSDGAGEVIGLGVISFDITDRKRAIEALRISEERLQLALSGADISIWDWNLATDEIYLSDSWFEMFGFRQAELEITPQIWQGLAHPNDLQKVTECLNQHLTNQEQHKVFAIESRMRTKSNDWKWVAIEGKVVERGSHGEPLRMVGVNKDITDKKNTQTQLIQSEKMSSLGQLVAGIAHEINNPVSFIFGNIEHAHQYFQDLINIVQTYQEYCPIPSVEVREKLVDLELNFMQEDFNKLLNSMRNGALRIRDIVRSLRTFSRLDEADMKDVDLHEGLDSTLLILESRMNGTMGNPIIQVQKNYGQLPKVNCYAGEINQVFMNILLNAIDVLQAQPAPRFITITTEMMKNFTEHHQAYAVIRIGDNGPGMSEQIKERIFDPFFTTKPVGAGTGMGLAIAHSIIIDKHQGKLICNSVPGEGTEFAIALPY